MSHVPSYYKLKPFCASGASHSSSGGWWRAKPARWLCWRRGVLRCLERRRNGRLPCVKCILSQHICKIYNYIYNIYTYIYYHIIIYTIYHINMVGGWMLSTQKWSQLVLTHGPFWWVGQISAKTTWNHSGQIPSMVIKVHWTWLMSTQEPGFF